MFIYFNFRVDKKDILRKKHDQKYREQHREEINKRKRETWQRQQNVQHIATTSNVYSIDKTQQITEATPDHQHHQLKANCSKPSNPIQKTTDVIPDGQPSENYSIFNEI